MMNLRGSCALVSCFLCFNYCAHARRLSVKTANGRQRLLGARSSDSNDTKKILAKVGVVPGQECPIGGAFSGMGCYFGCTCAWPRKCEAKIMVSKRGDVHEEFNVGICEVESAKLVGSFAAMFAFIAFMIVVIWRLTCFDHQRVLKQQKKGDLIVKSMLAQSPPPATAHQTQYDGSTSSDSDDEEAK
mmetsp:Transcript_68607/g.108212  ORF Transcript_68607/g.108212 Transcript_68607/m.108212 type:complete len:187 (+) Transcript_68607:45-605(+)